MTLALFFLPPTSATTVIRDKLYDGRKMYLKKIVQLQDKKCLALKIIWKTSLFPSLLVKNFVPKCLQPKCLQKHIRRIDKERKSCAFFTNKKLIRDELCGFWEHKTDNFACDEKYKKRTNAFSSSNRIATISKQKKLGVEETNIFKI